MEDLPFNLGGLPAGEASHLLNGVALIGESRQNPDDVDLQGRIQVASNKAL